MPKDKFSLHNLVCTYGKGQQPVNNSSSKTKESGAPEERGRATKGKRVREAGNVCQGGGKRPVKAKKGGDNRKNRERVKCDQNSDEKGGETSCDMQIEFENDAVLENHDIKAYTNMKKKYASLVRTLSGEDVEVRDASVVSPEQNMDEIAGYLHSKPQNTLVCETSKQVACQSLTTTVVTRDWEESFMKEASASERSCVNAFDHTCMASKIKSNGLVDNAFSLVEFYTPVQYRDIERDGWKWPQKRSKCILCTRAAIFSRFLSMRCNNVVANSNVCFAEIGNIVGERGEYCVEDVFVSSPDRYEGVVIPVVIPSVDSFRVYRNGGLRHLEQLLARPEDKSNNFFFF